VFVKNSMPVLWCWTRSNLQYFHGITRKHAYEGKSCVRNDIGGQPSVETGGSADLGMSGCDAVSVTPCVADSLWKTEVWSPHILEFETDGVRTIRQCRVSKLRSGLGRCRSYSGERRASLPGAQDNQVTKGLQYSGSHPYGRERQAQVRAGNAKQDECIYNIVPVYVGSPPSIGILGEVEATVTHLFSGHWFFQFQGKMPVTYIACFKKRILPVSKNFQSKSCTSSRDFINGVLTKNQCPYTD
jgi:hypothetical protein